MRREDIKVTFVGMEPTDALKEYANQKITKHENYLEKAIAIDIVLKDRKSNKGIKSDFEFGIKVVLPKGFIHVEEIGPDLYALIDRSVEVLVKRFKRYEDKFNQWEGAMPWKVLEANEYIDAVDDESPEVVSSDFVSYTPRIASREKLVDMRPMEEAEAIEQMELSGHDQILFKNIKNGKISMLYRRFDGNFTLVEPEEL
jgi:ribosomal subunit interface protein